MTIPELVRVIATLGLVAAIWWSVRFVIARRVERRFERANPRNPHGIILGAESIRRPGTRPGAVLLLHGYNDSPQAVASLAEALYGAGWTVHAPVLPGHARTLQEFSQSSAVEWIGAARAEFLALRRHHDVVVIGGMSMGGALAVLVASEHPDVRAVFGIAPYVGLSRPFRLLLALSPLAVLGAKYMSSGGGRSVLDTAAANAMIAYRKSTPRLLRELGMVANLALEAMPRVTQPVLFIQSREDNRIAVRSAMRAFERLGSPDKTLDWVTGAGHVLTVDYGHEKIERRIVEWLDVRK